jgi:hypothetical protein
MTWSPSEATPPGTERCERVYRHRPPASRRQVDDPATLSLTAGTVTLTPLDGSQDIIACATTEIRKVVIDHATLHFHLVGHRVAVALYPSRQSQESGQAARVLYAGTFVNGWANMRDSRVAGWKRALRANGVTVRDRNMQLIPPVMVMAAVFAALIVLTVAIQIAHAL